MKPSQPWIKSAAYDMSFIVMPAFVSVLIAWALESHGIMNTTPLTWFILVLGIDVLHVYGTLFRTYMNPQEFKAHQPMLLWVPVCVWCGGVLLCAHSIKLFWCVAAYMAVFHFIRQQYGFVRLYARKESQTAFFRYLETMLIYLSMLYPMVYWHAHLPRDMHWLIEGDFIEGMPAFVPTVLGIVYGGAGLLYAISVGMQVRGGKPLNIPKVLIVVGTALSWGLGIVYFNGDMAFTVTNVISHGVPYVALIWVYGSQQIKRTSLHQTSGIMNVFFRVDSFPLYLLFLFVCGYVEEGLWDGLVWRDHPNFFVGFAHLPQVLSTSHLTWLVPLLSLPQLTHYVLDGFIWRIKQKDAHWQQVVFSAHPQGPHE